MAFMRKFVKTVYGYVKVDAMNAKEAQREFDDGDYEKFDNKSEYDFEDWEVM